MKNMFFALSAASLALMPVAVLAQALQPLIVVDQDKRTSAAAAAAAAPIDPQLLAAARVTVDHIFPAGTYARIMNASMNGMLDNMVNSMGQLPLSEIAGLAGEPPAQVATLGKSTLADIMAIIDPVHDQRTSIIMHSTMTAITSMMAELEPDIRAGLAEAYARRFTAGQLADMNRFFATPSGAAYAVNAMSIQTDPAVMAKMQAIVPVLLQRLPAAIEQAKQATAKLPPVRKITDLTPAEKAKLAGLLGVPEAQLAADAAKK